MRKGECEMLIIVFAHDENFIFKFHAGTVFVYYSSKTFRDNWNFGSKLSMLMPLNLFMRLIDIKGQICL